MTAADFAALLDARPVGVRKWMGRCPAHRDRLPSLSIGEGRDGRVLLNCFSGCILSNILRAMKLQRRDLFSTEPPTPEQRQRSEAQRERARRAGRLIGEAAADARMLETHVDRLGAELARMDDRDPSGPEATARFHAVCDEMHIAEQKWQQLKTGRAVNATR
jgi:hypothetical protein